MKRTRERKVRVNSRLTLSESQSIYDYDLCRMSTQVYSLQENGGLSAHGHAVGHRSHGPRALDTSTGGRPGGAAARHPMTE